MLAGALCCDEDRRLAARGAASVGAEKPAPRESVRALVVVTAGSPPEIVISGSLNRRSLFDSKLPANGSDINERRSETRRWAAFGAESEGPADHTGRVFLPVRLRLDPDGDTIGEREALLLNDENSIDIWRLTTIGAASP